MMKYLWDFSFEELFFTEGGEQLLEELTISEWVAISKVKNIFEKISEISRSRVRQIDSERFAVTIPELVNADAMLQLCLIYGLAVQEEVPRKDKLEEIIRREASLYFKEYRGFKNGYSFEQYSFFNRIADI